MEKSSFKGCARFNDAGEMVCFCYEVDVLAGRCECKQRFDLPEALITVETVTGTRPSDLELPPVVQEVKSAEGHLKKLASQSKEIKKSLQNLEKAAKRTRFRI